MRPEFEHLRKARRVDVEERSAPRRFDDIIAAATEVHQAVILGEPGAGKTTGLYKLAGNALTAAAQDPVV